MLIKQRSAIEYFNKEAEEIFSLLSPLSEKRRTQRLPKSISEQVATSFDEKDIEYETKSLVNIDGKEIARYFFVEPELWIGLDLINYKRFEKFIFQLQKIKNIKNIISEKALKSITFSWLKEKYLTKDKKVSTFVQFFESDIPKYLKKFRLSIPISYLDIDDSFELGRTKFEYFKRDLFDKIENRLMEGVKDNKLTLENAKLIIKKIRKNYQGKVVASYIINAEKEKAIEIANEEAEKALLILKFFSPPAFFPKINANFGRKGIAHLPCEYVFIFENEIPVIHESVVGTTRIGFVIDHHILKKMFQLGLNRLNEIIKKEKINEFEELLLSAIYTYSKALSFRDFHEKLIFILSSAEIAFLKDYAEPIQFTLGQRLGFFVFDDAEKRKRVVKLIKDAYEIRSKFLHHGRFNIDYSLLRELQITIWNALKKMIVLSDNFRTKLRFISYVENIIYE